MAGQNDCRGHQSFNPRARDGRENTLINKDTVLTVSIHAPVMDAKMRFLMIVPMQLVSIHAPVMDANFEDILL